MMTQLLFRKLKAITIISLAAFFASSVLAEDSGLGRIAVVSIERAILQTDPAKKALEEYRSQKTISEQIKDFEAKRDAYEKKAEDYTKNRAVMSDTKRAEEELELANMTEDLQYVRNKILKSEEAVTKQILQQISPASAQVLENIVKEQAIGLLLRWESGAVIHADSGYDITNQLTERLNQMVKK